MLAYMSMVFSFKWQNLTDGWHHFVILICPDCLLENKIRRPGCESCGAAQPAHIQSDGYTGVGRWPNVSASPVVADTVVRGHNGDI